MLIEREVGQVRFKSFIARLKLMSTEECRMIEDYTILIMSGLATISRVPARHKDVDLATLGLDSFNSSDSKKNCSTSWSYTCSNVIFFFGKMI